MNQLHHPDLIHAKLNGAIPISNDVAEVIWFSIALDYAVWRIRR
jgi:hypothetical protein